MYSCLFELASYVIFSYNSTLVLIAVEAFERALQVSNGVARVTQFFSPPFFSQTPLIHGSVEP